MITIRKEKNIGFLLYIIMLDLVFGGAGRYFEIFGMSARIIIFSISMILCLLNILFKKQYVNSRFYFPFFVFSFSLFMSTFIGLYLYSGSSVFNGLSGYLNILLIIYFIQNIKTKEMGIKLFEIFNFMVVVLSIISILFFVLLYIGGFSFYSIVNPILIDRYLGFLDINPNGIVRVFLKTSVFIPMSCIYYLFNILYDKKVKIKTVFYFIVVLLGLITTMTMSFWIAFIIGFIIIFLLFNKKRINSILIIVTIVILVLSLDKIGSNPIDILSSRLNSNDSSLMLKQAQISVLWDTFKQHIFLGNGFGKNVILNFNGTYRDGSNWENMWLYLLVTSGIFGVLAYLNLIFAIIRQSIKYLNNTSNEEKVVLSSIIIGLIMQCIISLSNPYLNNPIGISFLCLSAGIVNQFIRTKKNT